MINLDTEQRKIIEETAAHNLGLQHILCIEEMAELMQAISKYTRTDPSSYNDVTELREKITENKNNIVEEMADVYITLEELRVHHRISDQQIHENIDYKLERQRKRNAKQRNTEHD